MNKRSTAIWMICGFVILAGSGGIYWMQSGSSAAPGAPVSITYAVKRSDLMKTVTSSGSVAARNSASLSFSGKSKVTLVHVQPGDRVQKGQLLAEMDPSTFQNAVLSAQAAADSANAKLKALHQGADPVSISSQKLQITKAKLDMDAAGLDYKTQYELNADSTATQSALGKYELAKGSYDLALKQLAKLQQGPDESELAVGRAAAAQAAANLSEAKNNLEGTRIYAPFNGLISAVNVKAGDLAAAAQAAVSMFSTDDSYLVAASIDDMDITSVQIGQDVNLTFDALAGVTLKGKISSKAVLGEAQNSGLVTFPVTVTITPGQQNEDKLIPGLSAALAIITEGKRNVLSIPDAAIRSIGGRKAVTIDNNGVPKQINITTGLDDGVRSEVVSGLAEGDKVTISITAPASRTSASTVQGGFGGLGGNGFGGGPFNRSGGGNGGNGSGSRQNGAGGGRQ